MSVYEVEQLYSGFWSIGESVVSNEVRMFLIEGTERALLVDTGFGTGDLRGLVEKITKLPVDLVLTHADKDHIGNTHQFDKAMMHPAEFINYRDSRADQSIEIIPVWEGHKIDLGTYVFEVVLISGHTPGSIALLDSKNRILISGDSVQAGPIYMFGPNRSLDGLIASMNKLKSIEDSFDIILSSHNKIPLAKEYIDDILIGAKKLKLSELPSREVVNKPFSSSDAREYYTDKVSFYWVPDLYEEGEISAR